MYCVLSLICKLTSAYIHIPVTLLSSNGLKLVYCKRKLCSTRSKYIIKRAICNFPHYFLSIKGKTDISRQLEDNPCIELNLSLRNYTTNIYFIYTSNTTELNISYVLKFFLNSMYLYCSFIIASIKKRCLFYLNSS